jgi:hypothetical protein
VVVGILIYVYDLAGSDTRIPDEAERVGALHCVRSKIDGLAEIHSAALDIKDGVGSAVSFDEARAT